MTLITMKTDLSIDLYLWGDLKLHRGHLTFLGYYYNGVQEYLPKHKFITELEKGGFIYEGEITLKGKALWEEIDNWDGVYTPSEKVKKKKVEYSPEFEELWNEFPATDNFKYADVEFNGTRSLRSKKDECSIKYQNILSENSVTHQEIIKALQWEVEARKDQSVVRKANQLSFMNAIPIWLNQRKFEAYIPLAKKAPYKSRNEYKGNTNSEIVI